jgi:hypothetical protein
VFYLKVQNTSEVAVQAPIRVEPEYGIVQYLVTNSSGDERLFEPWAFMEVEETYGEIAPNESAIGTAKLFFGAHGWTFRTPGRYRVVARHGEIPSNAVEIDVEAATHSAQAAAELLFDDPEAGFFLLLNGGDHLKSGIATLNSIRNTYPHSALSGYANFSLGSNLAKPFRDLSTGEVRDADPETALAYLIDSVDQLRDRSSFYYTLSAHNELAGVYGDVGATAFAMNDALLSGLERGFEDFVLRDELVSKFERTLVR